MRREATHRVLRGIPPDEATAQGSIPQANLSTNSDFSSVTFDLALDDWDDFSDDNFITAYEGRDSLQTTGGYIVLFQ